MSHRALWPLIVLSGCVSPLVNLKAETPLTVERAQFVIKSDGRSERDVARLERALQRVPAATGRWGSLTQPVTVYLVATHGDLEAAVGRFGFAWLRAWAHFDDVIFQAPSTWTANQEVVDELVIHELTHCVLFQASADEKSWLTRGIPLWFREGMALVTAQQHGRYPSLEDTARWFEEHPELDAFEDGEALSKERGSEVYGVALHAFEFLERRVGAEQVRAVMAAMRAGDDFHAAFARALGFGVGDFVKQFRAFLQARQFRELKRSVPAESGQQIDPRPK